MVRAASAFGHRADEIARYLKVGRTTLFRHYRDEIRAGAFEANLKVEKTGYQMATSGQHPIMTIFWLKTRCGYREVERVEIGGLDGAPLAAARFVISFADGGPGAGPSRRRITDPEDVPLLTVALNDADEA
jgi:hypothetical protein